MSKKFEFKLSKKSIKLNLEISSIKKITLKFVGIYGNEKIKFNSRVNVKFNLSTQKIKKINIVELEFDKFDKFDKFSKCDKYNDETYSDYSWRSIYLLPNDSCDSSSHSSIVDNEIYEHVLQFIKNIKLVINENKISSLIFNVKNTNIKKMKIKGKIY